MHEPRLSRLGWTFTQHPVFFITACTTSRQHLLANVPINGAFVSFANRAADHDVFVGRYVLMPDHLHLFVVVGTESLSLSDWMKSLKNALSKPLRAQGKPSPHWQKGFFDHVLRSEESYAEKWQYVVQNPVRAGLVKRAEDWPYQGEIYPLEARDL